MQRHILVGFVTFFYGFLLCHGASINTHHAVHGDETHFPPGQYGPMELITEDMKLFAMRSRCREACARSCKPIMVADTDNVFFLCSQLKPPEKSIPEKLFAKVSFPVMLLGGVICFALFICLVCCCRSMCCHGSNRSNHSSRDILHQRTINDITDNGGDFEKQPLPTSSIEENVVPPFKTMRSTKVHDV